MKNILLFSLCLISSTLAYSWNQTMSEYGMAFTWNSHLNLTEFDPEVEISEEDKAKEGLETPLLIGYITIYGNNEEKPIDGQQEVPLWNNDNQLRICL